MTIYVYDKATDRMVNRDTREPMVSGPWRPVTPMVAGDTPGYASPVTGDWIDGKRARRYDLERHGCVDANDLPSPTGGKLKNEAFAKKHGLEHLLEK